VGVASNETDNRHRLLGTYSALSGLLLLEIILFSLLGRNFATAGNAAEIARLAVEIGLLACALTPVIISGGIDLSVGSLMGLCAVLFGTFWRDFHQSIPVAIALTLLAGLAAGCLNGLLIARLKLLPLIVTLGTFSLFRGIAEGMTGGVDNFTGFPDSFLALGQGYLAGIPMQLPLLLLVLVCYWLYQQRTIYGRALFAIGFSPEGARHAGLPVQSRLFTVYALSGLVAGLAAVIYVSHLGQAKADAGTGYELEAITAVVLGGTSIFGGRGGIPGTLLGLAVIVVLKNGLRLADLPPELAGVLTGLILLTTMAADRMVRRLSLSTLPAEEGAFTMKNSQVAALCAVILVGAGIIAASNWYLVKSLPQGGGNQPTAINPATGRKIVIGMMPKSKGNGYFIACQKGAEEAARELGVELLWDGPTDPDPAKQNEVVEAWITRGVDVIAVAVENRDGLSSVLRKARARGIKVITWDADANADARDYFVNQATPQGIANALMDEAARIMDGKGEFAIIKASLTTANVNEWHELIVKRKEKYPDLTLVTTEPCDDKQSIATDKATAILNSHKRVKLLMAICSPAVPGAAEAVSQSTREDVKVIGLGLPNENKKFVREGITETVILWNTTDLGYLAVQAAKQVVDGTLKPGAKQLDAGRLGKLPIEGDSILLGEPFIFNKANIEKFDF
jgi:ribose/xylose/arabinose/galactoside ABC-type transport system permease subunit/ABC-type sugar transport system substrate-binding protein